MLLKKYLFSKIFSMSLDFSYLVQDGMNRTITFFLRLFENFFAIQLNWPTLTFQQWKLGRFWVVSQIFVIVSSNLVFISIIVCYCFKRILKFYRVSNVESPNIIFFRPLLITAKFIQLENKSRKQNKMASFCKTLKIGYNSEQGLGGDLNQVNFMKFRSVFDTKSGEKHLVFGHVWD